MNHSTYSQCLLRRGPAYQISWLPSQFASPGRTLRLRDDDGWRVAEVYATLPAAYVEAHERDYCHQRDASDR